MRVLLKNGTVIDYGSRLEDILDVLITDDKISKIEKNINEEVDQVIDCTNLFIIPRYDRYALSFKRTGVYT